MSMSFPSLFPGMALDAAARFAHDHAGPGPLAGDPLAEMGWPLTLVPEALGGAGGTVDDLGALVEGLATHGVHLPVAERCAAVPLLLQATAESAAHWLPPLCEGSAQVALLAALSAPLEDTTVQARQLDIGWELSGTVHGADAGLPATHAVLVARVQEGDELALFVLPADRLAPGPAYRTMEGRRAADVTLQAVSVPAAACIARGSAARDAVARAGDALLLLTAVDTVAALAALVQATVAHLKERRQFGVALATFQALRHRVADMFVRYQGARGLVVHALQLAQAGDTQAPRALRLAKVSLAETARWCAESAIQMHGGMGVSEEVLATRLAQRLLASEFRYGDRLTHASRLLRAPGLATANTNATQLTRSA